jgi:hypothetical protein
MAGTIKIIDEVTAAISADRTVTVQGGGAHGSANFYVDITAITAGAVVMKVRWKSAAGTAVDIATSASLTGTGVARLVPTTGSFDVAGCSIPEPIEVFWDTTAATGLTGAVYAMYGD